MSQRIRKVTEDRIDRSSFRQFFPPPTSFSSFTVCAFPSPPWRAWTLSSKSPTLTDCLSDWLTDWFLSLLFLEVILIINITSPTQGYSLEGPALCCLYLAVFFLWISQCTLAVLMTYFSNKETQHQKETSICEWLLSGHIFRLPSSPFL